MSMHGSRLIDLNWLVADALEEEKKLVNLFLAYQLACIGCSLERFCTLEDVCSHYALEPMPFLQQILQIRMEK